MFNFLNFQTLFSLSESDDACEFSEDVESDDHDVTESPAKRKMKQKKKYRQSFTQVWMSSFKSWLQETSDKQKAYCKICKTNLNAKKSNLVSHQNSKKHRDACAILDSKKATQQELSQVMFRGKEYYRARAEAWACMYVACHSTIRGVEHISYGCNSKFQDSRAAGMKLQKTKCTAVIRNLLAPHFSRVLRSDLADNPFSLLIDETTDIECKKILGIVIRFVNLRLKKISSAFLGFIELANGTAESIAKGVISLFNKYKLKIPNIVGIGCDNAASMTGDVGGGVRLLEKEWGRKLIMVRCVCHSIQLAASESCKILPNSLEYLVKHSYSWFSNCTLRKHRYKDIYCTIYETNKEPLKLVQVGDTRWLSIYSAVEKIVEQWHALKLFFEGEAKESTTAENLSKHYKNSCHYIFLCYLKKVLEPVQRLNKNFERNNDPFILYDDLIDTIDELASIILNKGSRTKLDIIKSSMDKIQSFLDPKPNFGVRVESKLVEIPLEQATQVRQICINFTLKLISELKNRLPLNIERLKYVKELSVQNATKSIKSDLTKEFLGLFCVAEKDIDAIERQWNRIANVNWNERKDSIVFWIEVYNYTDSCGNRTFQQLAQLAFKIIAMPVSNAEIERIFSFLSIVKNKMRNRLLVETTEAILKVRCGLLHEGQCCHNYELPDTVLAEMSKVKKYAEVEEIDSQTEKSIEKILQLHY